MIPLILHSSPKVYLPYDTYQRTEIIPQCGSALEHDPFKNAIAMTNDRVFRNSKCPPQKNSQRQKSSEFFLLIYSDCVKSSRDAALLLERTAQCCRLGQSTFKTSPELKGRNLESYLASLLHDWRRFQRRIAPRLGSLVITWTRRWSLSRRRRRKFFHRR